MRTELVSQHTMGNPNKPLNYVWRNMRAGVEWLPFVFLPGLGHFVGESGDQTSRELGQQLCEVLMVSSTLEVHSLQSILQRFRNSEVLIAHMNGTSVEISDHATVV